MELQHEIELDCNLLLTVPGGWKASQHEAEQPAGTYGEFKREILNETASCLNMPFKFAGNSAAYNYTLGRLHHPTYFRSIRVAPTHLECVVLDRILAAWLDETALISGLLARGPRTVHDWSQQWFWDGHEPVGS